MGFFPGEPLDHLVLKASEYGLVMSSSTSRPERFKFERRDNYPGTGGVADMWRDHEWWGPKLARVTVELFDATGKQIGEGTIAP